MVPFLWKQDEFMGETNKRMMLKDKLSIGVIVDRYIKFLHNIFVILIDKWRIK